MDAELDFKIGPVGDKEYKIGCIFFPHRTLVVEYVRGGQIDFLKDNEWMPCQEHTIKYREDLIIELKAKIKAETTRLMQFTNFPECSTETKKELTGLKEKLKEAEATIK